MLVVCGRCETEYEFDDALLSERGTTVKCTNCGHQFKVRPPRGVAAGGESWAVKKADGAEIRFPSLRELRRAIDTGLVGMDDELAREGGIKRRLKDVPELAALFRRRQPPAGHAQTLMGVGAADQVRPAAMPRRSSSASPEQASRDQASPPATKPSDRAAEVPVEPPPTSLIDMGGGARRTPVPRRPAHTPQGTPVAYESFSSEDRKSASFATLPPPAPGQPQQPDLASTWTSPSHDSPAKRATSPHEEPAVAGPVAAAPAQQVPSPPQALSSSGAPLHSAASSQAASPQATSPRAPSAPEPPSGGNGAVPASAVQFASVPPASVSPESSRPHAPPAPLSVPPPPRKASGVRWVIALVLLGGLALLAGTVGRDYLAQFVGGDSSSGDARVQALTEQGWELFRDGDLTATQAKFEEASALAHNDPHVQLGLIQLNLVRADVEWLRLRLLPESADDARSASEKSLQLHVDSAKRAFSTIPRLPDTAQRTALMETDALRLQGEYEQARALVERFTFDPTDPHAAYVLAMLDVGEGSQAWATVIERLRSALVSERALGRARSALIYALAASGDHAQARLELQKLNDTKPPHPLAGELKVFIDTLAAGDEESEDGAEGQADEGQPAATIDLDEDDESDRQGQQDGKSLVWLWLDKAGAARRSGDLPGAKSYYQKVIDASPGNANGLAGLGAIARLEGKYQEAKRYFDDVLERSPNHLPALVGGADVRWLMGAKEGAVLLYKKIPQSSSFYSHAQRRIADFEGRGGGDSEAPEKKPAQSDEAEGDEAPAADDSDEGTSAKPPVEQGSAEDKPAGDLPSKPGADGPKAEKAPAEEPSPSEED